MATLNNKKKQRNQLTIKKTPDCNLWAVHPDHCFNALDKKALYHLIANIRDTCFIKEKLPKIKRRITGKAGKYVSSWWKDVLALLEYGVQR